MVLVLWSSTANNCSYSGGVAGRAGDLELCSFWRCSPCDCFSLALKRAVSAAGAAPPVCLLLPSPLPILGILTAHLLCLEASAWGHWLSWKLGVFHQDQVLASVPCTAAQPYLVRRQKCWGKLLLTVLLEACTCQVNSTWEKWVGET